METVVLRTGSPQDAADRASEVLAAYLAEFCDAAARGLRAQREFLTYCKPLLDEQAASTGVWQLDMSDVNQAIRLVGRTRRRPLPRARRELKRLLVLLDGVPFERLAVAPRSLTAFVRPRPPDSAAAPGGAFEICLPLPESGHFPVYIRKPTASGEELLFVQPGRHGACRGEAEPLLETAVEQLDLCGLVLVALAWARRNL